MRWEIEETEDPLLVARRACLDLLACQVSQGSQDTAVMDEMAQEGPLVSQVLLVFLDLLVLLDPMVIVTLRPATFHLGPPS